MESKSKLVRIGSGQVRLCASDHSYLRELCAARGFSLQQAMLYCVRVCSTVLPPRESVVMNDVDNCGKA